MLLSYRALELLDGRDCQPGALALTILFKVYGVPDLSRQEGGEGGQRL